eukprot:SAG31_NODE_9124_length_1330_cov_0.678310_1_plen_67_part_10
MVGYDVKMAYDPCPSVPVDWDGLEIDWKSPAYCNPPFSKTYEWMEKCVHQAEKVVDVIVMISGDNYC